MKCFFDSNIIVDAFTNREGAVDIERRLLYGAIIGEVDGAVSAKQMTDIYYVLRKYIAKDGLRRELISILLEGLEILPTDKPLLKQALKSDVPDYEDAVIVECAKAVGSDFIITNDKDGFKHSDVAIKTPKEAVAFLGLK